MDILSFIAISVGAPIVIVFVAFFIPTWGGQLDVIRDKGVYPSLSRFQAVLWTLAFAYTILSVILLKLSTGIYTSPTGAASNYTTTLLVGALTSVAFGQGLSENKYTEYYSNSIGAGNFVNPVGHPKAGKPIPKDGPRKFKTMLMEDGKFSITRVQLFAWTWIALLVYVLTFSLNLGAAFADQKTVTVSLPDIDHNLLALSGISQAGFVAGKAAIKKAQPPQATANPDPALI